MSPVDLSEKFLADTGGWQAMKEARALLEMGRVSGAAYSPPLLKGMVREGDMDYRAGLKITGRTDVENICGCRESRQWGKICAHSLAVGLAVLRAREPRPPQQVEEPKNATPSRGPLFSTSEAGEKITLQIVLPPNFQQAWEKNEVKFVVEAVKAGGRCLLQALNPAISYRCSQAELRFLEQLRILNGGELAGMIILDRKKTIELIETLRNHPGVTFGRGKKADVNDLLTSLGTEPEAVAGVGGGQEAPVMIPNFALSLNGSLNYLTARLQCVYGKRIVSTGTPEQFPGRNLEAERSALKRLTKYGFTGPNAVHQWILKGENGILTFIANELPLLQQEFDVTYGSQFHNVSEEVERISPRIEIRSSGETWFEMSVDLVSQGGERFSGAEIQRLLQMGKSHLRLRSGKTAVFDSGLLNEFQNVLMDCNPGQDQPGIYRLNRVHAGYLQAVMGTSAKIVAPPVWQEWASSQRQLVQNEPVPLGDLEEVLRPYQKQGVYWLNFIAKNGFGGILADEMGLGKTVQALAFLRHLKGCALVVCPSSLIFNWEREAARFAPDLRVLSIQGSDRTPLFHRIGGHDLIITSYPLLRRDIENYRKIDFDTVILDEAQHIKNPDTQNAQAAAALKARNRFVLSGTPMENSVRDLWSIMHFLMPGYLGTRNDFKERYEQPILRDDSSQTCQRLSKRIKPFMLRRLKKDILTELPDKIEQVSYCELTKEQRDVYAALLKEARAGAERFRDDGQRDGRARMLILTALMRLRQVCCDLRLLDLPEVDQRQSSAKLELLGELLQEAVDGGHRILIFSQFVAMLAILKGFLDELKLPFCYLDGQTRERAREVDRFQNNPDVPVFLISLKAGGVGLNLTAADTVIHFDPWWNPAVENQATDRVHRIGQAKVVTSYKLITRNTVEEKILKLQLKKREMIDAMVESEQPLMSGLSIDEINEVLLD